MVEINLFSSIQVELDGLVLFGEQVGTHRPESSLFMLCLAAAEALRQGIILWYIVAGWVYLLYKSRACCDADHDYSNIPMQRLLFCLSMLLQKYLNHLNLL